MMTGDQILEIELNRYMNKTLYNEEWGVYFIKEQVGKVRNLKIHIYANDHNPPHFHVFSNDKSVNATFRIDNGNFIQGDIGGKDKKRVRAYFEAPRIQQLLKEHWNKSKDDQRKA